MSYRLSSPRSVALLAGGALCAAFAARMLPPIVARTVGGAMGVDGLRALESDHKRFLELLDGMIESDGAAMRGQRFLRLKRRLAAHALAEEDVVYPLLEEHERDEHARKLYAEHADMKILLSALERLPNDSEAWVAKARELRALIESHARQEEDVEFPKLRERLAADELARLSGGVLREKAMIV
jgi:hemerythrin superfamily protein